MTTAADGSYRARLLGLLGERNPLESLEATARRVEEVARRLGEAGLSRSYGPGKWNLALLRGLDADDLAREAVHPERGPETLETIVRLWAGHDFNHLAQLESL
jgi:hypothetical protein